MKTAQLLNRLHQGDARAVARAISLVEDQQPGGAAIMAGLDPDRLAQALVVGITGPPGAGKSTLTASLVKNLRTRDTRVGIIAVDPSSPLTGGALLGDRIRMMEHSLDPDVVLRSMATRGRLGGLCASAGAAMRILAASGCRVILIETVGIGQSEMDIAAMADITLMVLAPGFGDDIQAMKAGILEVVDVLVINKADQPGAQKLLLDLGKEAASSERVVQTIASEHKGVEQLLELVFSLETTFKQQGEQQKRRERSRRKETLDWTFELLKPHLHNIISTTQPGQDPGQIARDIVSQLLAATDRQ